MKNFEKGSNVVLEAKNTLVGLFNTFFEVLPVNTLERFQESCQLRYRVYCQEAKDSVFDPGDYPEKLEYDLYDKRSVHSLLVHKPSGKIAGTVRIVLPIKGSSDARFPIEEFAGHSFYPDNESLKHLQRSQLGEISRLIIAPEFRMRRGELLNAQGLTRHTDYSTEYSGQCKSYLPWKDQGSNKSAQRRRFPHTILGLFVAIVRMSAENDLTCWYALMEPVCERLLQSFGIYFKPISPVVDFHGFRRSYLGNISDILGLVYRTDPEIWALLTNNGVFFPHSIGS